MLRTLEAEIIVDHRQNDHVMLLIGSRQFDSSIAGKQFSECFAGCRSRYFVASARFSSWDKSFLSPHVTKVARPTALHVPAHTPCHTVLRGWNRRRDDTRFSFPEQHPQTQHFRPIPTTTPRAQSEAHAAIPSAAQAANARKLAVHKLHHCSPTDTATRLLPFYETENMHHLLPCDPPRKAMPKHPLPEPCESGARFPGLRWSHRIDLQSQKTRPIITDIFQNALSRKPMFFKTPASSICFSFANRSSRLNGCMLGTASAACSV